mmetsp:Transcript_25043/g.70590  ORF Transcript_25043/g.70590 Transcript_25043/m.70590 type:complete len:424 (-) Transcript_25043:22-1293(-)|eukprot:CAMPEP_0179261228 /NCGR_PEP_ID=MMETSP0797-20121207/26752_1 /TAXON_ID=47934 /ORGANISM="Dinophysis acuminata, Strain DAEP01" /LENGTH=423 /DNA_ID=CAMNT_0020969343 /DNA_START=66 /DNA_END=1337 /DNA_ORIENTATION=-
MALPTSVAAAQQTMNSSLKVAGRRVLDIGGVLPLRAGAGHAAQALPGRRHATAARAAQPRRAGSREDPQLLYDELKLKFGYLGAVNHKEVGVLDLYRIMQASKARNHYGVCLNSMNLFYNFGVKLKHRELASRLLATAMNCKMEAEALELIKLYGTWLENPPDISLVYAVMGHFLDAGEPHLVREIAKAVREDWRMPVGAPLYILAIEAMLQLPANPLGEAMELYDDAIRMGVRLPAPLHVRLLLESLREFKDAAGDAGAAEADAAPSESTPPAADPEAAEAAGAGAGAASSPAGVPDGAVAHLQTALRVADNLARDGYLRGGANAATLCSLSSLFWHLAALPGPASAQLRSSARPGGATAFLGGDWARLLEAATENFGCHWGFSARLPRSLFQDLEASPDPEAARLVEVSRARFGRFYPAAH